MGRYLAGHISHAAGMVCVSACQGTLVISAVVSSVERRVEVSWLEGTPEKAVL